MNQTVDRSDSVLHLMPEVSDEDAGPEIKRVLDDLKATLRIHYVPSVFRALAVYPDYLRTAWPQLRVNMETAHFVSSVEELRASIQHVSEHGASRNAVAPVGVPDVLRHFHSLDPAIYLVATTLRSASTGQRPRLTELPPHDKRRAVLSEIDSPAFNLVDPSNVDADLLELLVEISRSDGDATIPDCFRALAVWPGYLRDCRDAILSGISPATMRQLRIRLRAAGDGYVQTLPFRMDLGPHVLRQAGMDEEGIERVRQILERNLLGLSHSMVSTSLLVAGSS